ncbi:MAG: aminotransferase class V-fold PLP-dependent enzyme [Pirellulaceae bacterium]|nr:aminotransferase class V-fold PLP-dependent enzyme [Pirellulaceae bacterium]
MSEIDEFTDLPARFRPLMPIAARLVYFDHAAVAPLPAPTRDAMRQWLDQATNQGDVAWPAWARRVEEVRRTAAALIAAQPDEIALIPNTTTGIGLIAEGYPWREGDNIVTLANEFPSNQYPWMNLASRGVETRTIPAQGGRIDLDRLEATCDERTRIVSLSWVGFATGWRIDPREIGQLCRRKGCLFFLDAIQGLGVFPLDVHAAGVDFLAADGHKWLLGPEGAGILFVKREHLSLLRPLGCGWNSVVAGSDYSRIDLKFRPEAARYEGGSHNMIGIAGLGASLDLLASLGLSPHNSPIADQVLASTDYAAAQLMDLGATLLAPREAENRSGIVTFQLPGHDPHDIRRRLEAAGTIVRCRAGGVRISPHGYATRFEVDALIGELRQIVRGQ